MKKSTHTREYAALRDELRSARENSGLSQRELASRLRVPPSWISKVETGERRIDLVEFCWYLAACGIDPVPASKELLQRIAALNSPHRERGGRK